MSERGRKPHKNDPGYVAERRNPYTDGYVVLYRIPEDATYRTVCTAHKHQCTTTSLATARAHMKSPGEWCDSCKALQRGIRMRLTLPMIRVMQAGVGSLIGAASDTPSVDLERASDWLAGQAMRIRRPR
jgi:hypothetical protein